MRIHPSLRQFMPVILLACFAPMLLADEAKDHLQAAAEIVRETQPAQNEYAYDAQYIHWKGVDGARYEVRCDCSAFVTLIFEHVYGYTSEQMKKWTGHKRPLAKHYHDEIEAAHGFARIKRVTDIKPGDLLAVKYLETSKDTGHVMIVAGPPVAHDASAPLLPDTRQWEVSIIDCSKSGHGPTDTRRRSDKTFASGAGQGELRLYSNESGEIVGYTWSTLAKSELYTPEKHHLVAGRLKPEFKP